jgi:hypothetical protein
MSWREMPARLFHGDVDDGFAGTRPLDPLTPPLGEITQSGAIPQLLASEAGLHYSAQAVPEY